MRAAERDFDDDMEPARTTGATESVAATAAVGFGGALGAGARPADVLRLQRAVGNAAVARMIARRADAVPPDERELAAPIATATVAAAEPATTQPPRAEPTVQASGPVAPASPVAGPDGAQPGAAESTGEVAGSEHAQAAGRSSEEAGAAVRAEPDPGARAAGAAIAALAPSVAPPADSARAFAAASSPASTATGSSGGLASPTPAVAAVPVGSPVASNPPMSAVDDAPLVQAVAAGRQAIGSTAELTARTGITPSAQSVIDVVTAAAARGEDLLMQASHEALDAVEHEVSTQRAAVDAAALAQHGEVCAAFEDTRAHVSSAHAAETAGLGAAHEREQNKTQAEAERASQQLAEHVDARVQRARTLSEEHSQRAAAAGDDGAGKAKAHLESARQQVGVGADGKGGDATAAAKAEVASRVGGDGARQIDHAAGEAPAHIRDHAAAAAGSLREQGESVAITMAAIAPRAAAEAQTASSMAVEAQNISRQRAGAALGEGAAAAVDGLGHQQHGFTTATGDEVAKVHQDLVGAGSEAAKAIAEKARDTIAEARRMLDEQLAPLQGEAPAGPSEPSGDEPDAADGGSPPPAASPPPNESAAAAAEAAAQVEQTYASAASELRGDSGDVTSSLGSAGRDAVEGIGGLSAIVRDQLTPAVGAVTGALVGIREEAEGSLVALGGQAATAADQVLAGTGGALDAGLGQADAGLGGGVDQLNQSIDSGVAGTQTHAGDAVADVQRRVGEGEQRIAEHAPQPSSGGLQRVVARSILGSIGGWLEEQWNDFVELISSPSFWVGLIVTLVLFPALGPGALVVGGAAGGFVAGVEKNLSEGKKWWDPHNLIVATFVGAAAGAAMAFAAGVVVGLGLEGLAATAAIMGASALIGIVVNLATGQRWDKGLIANLFLGWLIERVFRAARGRGRETPLEEKPVAAEVLTKGQRLRLFVDRLRGQPGASSKAEALQQIRDTMNAVEDAHSGAPNEPANHETDGRMYPPQDDAARPVVNRPDVTRYRSKGHNTFIRDNGAIEIRPADAGNGPDGAGRATFTKPGADGRGVWEP
jgi:hypothetical protein